jgi:hypothetical protein
VKSDGKPTGGESGNTDIKNARIRFRPGAAI